MRRIPQPNEICFYLEVPPRPYDGSLVPVFDRLQEEMRSTIGTTGEVHWPAVNPADGWRPVAYLAHQSKIRPTTEICFVGESRVSRHDLEPRFQNGRCQLCGQDRQRKITMLATHKRKIIQVGLDCFKFLWNEEEEEAFRSEARRHYRSVENEAKRILAMERALLEEIEAGLD